MNIPTFKNTHDAVAFVRKHFGDPKTLELLKAKRKEMEKEADAMFGMYKRTGIRPTGFSEFTTSLSSYREAIEMMNKESQWKDIWGPLVK